MRKKITGHAEESNRGWMELEPIATVEATSEDPLFPLESAFDGTTGTGWRASESGEQKVRVVFDQPVSLRRIELRFEETQSERTQEFSLRWLPAGEGRPTEIARQQWNFSPGGSTSEVEDYRVDLKEVSALELWIQPDISRREAFATLASLRLA